MPLAALLKEILVCPQCHGELQERADGLFCAHDALLFPIRDGLPVMLLEEAIKVSVSSEKNEAAVNSVEGTA